MTSARRSDADCACNTYYHQTCLKAIYMWINHSFMTEICNDEANAAIVNALIILVDTLRLQVIAESVEIVEQRDLLHKCGYGQVQCSVYGKPMPVDELEDFIQQKLFKT